MIIADLAYITEVRFTIAGIHRRGSHLIAWKQHEHLRFLRRPRNRLVIFRPGLQARLAYADGEQQIGPQGLVAGLDGKDVVSGIDSVIKIPAGEWLKRDIQICRFQDGSIIIPDRRIMWQFIWIVVWHSHGVHSLDGNGGKQYFQDLWN